MKHLFFYSFVTLVVLLNCVHISHQLYRYSKSAPTVANEIGLAPEDLKDALVLLNTGKKSLGLNTENTNLLLQLVEHPNDKNESEKIQKIVQDLSKSNSYAADGKQYLALSDENRQVHIDNYTNVTPDPRESFDNSSVVEDVFKMVMEQKDPNEKVLHKITIIETSEAKPYHESLSLPLPDRGRRRMFRNGQGLSHHRQRRTRCNPFWEFLRGKYAVNEKGEWSVFDKKNCGTVDHEDVDGMSSKKKFQYLRNDYSVAGRDDFIHGTEEDTGKSGYGGPIQKLETSTVPRFPTKALPLWLNGSPRRPSWSGNIHQEKGKTDYPKNVADKESSPTVSSGGLLQTESEYEDYIPGRSEIKLLAETSSQSTSSTDKPSSTTKAPVSISPAIVNRFFFEKTFMDRSNPMATDSPSKEKSSSNVVQAVGLTCVALLCLIGIFQVYSKLVQWYPGLLGNKYQRGEGQKGTVKWPRGLGKIVKVVVPNRKRDLLSMEKLYDGMSYKTLMISDDEDDLMVADLEWQSEMGDWLPENYEATPDPQS